MVLGILNAWQNIDRDRVKLRVMMKVGFPKASDTDWENHPHLSVKVINGSPFPLTIAEIGVRQKAPPSELSLGNALFLDGPGLPRRIEPRSSVTAYFPLTVNMDFLRNVVRVYVRTDTGKTVYSPRRQSRKAIKQVVFFLPEHDESEHGD